MAITVAFNNGLRWTDYNAFLTGATSLSAFVIITTADPLVSGNIFGKWSFFGFGQCFNIALVGSNIQFYVAGGGYRGRITTTSPIAPGKLYRILCQWSAAGVMDIWVNGTKQTVAIDSGNNAAVAGLAATVSTEVTLGLQNAYSNSAAAGEYCESALWNTVLSDATAQLLTGNAEGQAQSPAAFTTNLFRYTPLCGTQGGFPDPGLIDVVGPTNVFLWSVGANVSHPWVDYPEGSPYALYFCPVTNPFGEFTPAFLGTFGPLIWIEFDDPTDDATHVFSITQLNDPITYYHGPKKGTILSMERVNRALSSDDDGNIEGQRWGATLADTDRYWRGILGQEDITRLILNRNVRLRMISNAGRIAQEVPRTVALGLIETYGAS